MAGPRPTHGSLFVAAKNPNGFIVRETQGGRSNVSFDYRIVATALGQSSQRMSLVNPATLGSRGSAPAVRAPAAEPPSPEIP